MPVGQKCGTICVSWTKYNFVFPTLDLDDVLRVINVNYPRIGTSSDSKSVVVNFLYFVTICIRYSYSTPIWPNRKPNNS